MKARRSLVICLLALASVFFSYPAFLFAEEYTITATAGPCGTITPSGEIKVQQGERITFSITPAESYYWIYDITVDGVSVGAQNEYTFRDITSDHTIHAIFIPHGDPYTITSSCGDHGSISPLGNITVMNGENQNFTITPYEDYDIDTLEIDGIAISFDDYRKDDHYEYEFENVSASHSIKVFFRKLTSVTLIEKKLTQTSLTLGFSQSIDPSTINSGTFLVKAHIPGIGYGTVSGDIRCSGSTVMFTPYSDLRPEVNYAWTMTTGVKDLNGNSLEADYTEAFILSDISAAEAQYQAVLDANVSELDAPGGILYVDDPKYGEFYMATGYSNQETQTLMIPTDRFRIASITKTFTAACVLLLAEDGFLSLDDPIRQYVPDLEIPFDEVITIRQLLNHTSGLADYLDTGYVFNTMLQDQSHVFQPEELVQITLTISPDLLSDPGTEFYYSNTNYVVLGLIIETVTGKNYGDVIRTRLIEPLGLTNTFVPNDETIPGSYAHGYMRYAGQITDVTFLHPSVAWVAGNMISTAGDLGRWAKALYGGEVLSDASLTEMLTYLEDSENPDMKYGLGVMYDLERNVIGHTGGIPGYVCAMYYDFETGDVKVFAANLSDEDNSERAAIRFVPSGVQSFTFSPA